MHQRAIIVIKRHAEYPGLLRGGRFGEVFPPLPDPSDLLLPAIVPQSSRDDSKNEKLPELLTYLVEAPGIEPGSENALLLHLRV